MIIRKLAVVFMAKKKIEKIWRIKKSNLILENETEKTVCVFTDNSKFQKESYKLLIIINLKFNIMKKLRLLLMMLAAAAVTFTACEPAPQGGSGEGEGGEIPVIEFYSTLAEGQNLAQMGAGVSGHMINFVSADYSQQMMLLVVDPTVAPEEYTYLPNGYFPSVNCENDPSMPGMPVFPSVPATVCTPGFSMFGYYDEATDTFKEYTFVAGAEEDGYGVSVMTLMPNEDENMIEFNLLAEDADGNKVIVRGSFTGPLGYQVGPAQKPCYELNMIDYRFLSFEREDLPGGYVRLKSSNNNGDFVITLDPQGGEIATADGVQYDVADGNLMGYHWDSMDDVTFSFVSGSISLKTTETAGVYTLVVSDRNPLTMTADGWRYDLNVPGGEYAITVTVPVATFDYNLVMSDPADWTGEYLVGDLNQGVVTYMSERSSYDYATTYMNAVALPQTAFDGLTVCSETELPTIKVAKVDGAEGWYSIQFNGEYIGWDSGNFFAFSETAPTAADSKFIWKFACQDESKVKIELAAKDGDLDRWFQWNANNTRFSCYRSNSNQADVSLFVAVK